MPVPWNAQAPDQKPHKFLFTLSCRNRYLSVYVCVLCVYVYIYILLYVVQDMLYIYLQSSIYTYILNIYNPAAHLYMFGSVFETESLGVQSGLQLTFS